MPISSHDATSSKGRNLKDVTALILRDGISGITAARKLSENCPENFKIIEARNELWRRLPNRLFGERDMQVTVVVLKSALLP